MKPTVLVATSVHAADDTRIRERLLRTLDAHFSVSYATGRPGPSDPIGPEWIPLEGGRLSRDLRLLKLALNTEWDLLVLHDPETVPIGVAARLLRRKPVVFDLHEDFPAQLAGKEWAPQWAEPILRGLGRLVLALAERFLVVTLAEAGYARLFRSPKPVFPNFPRSDDWPEPGPGGTSALYVGDVTETRGVGDAAEACRIAGVRLDVVGPVRQEIAQLRRPHVTVHGRLAHAGALEMMRRAGIGLSPLRPAPNYLHSLPTKVLEYLAMGLPVVATDLPGTREVLTGLDASWLVSPGDSKAMAAAIEQALRPESMAAARNQAPEIRHRFQWPEEDVLAFFTSVARRTGTPGPS